MKICSLCKKEKEEKEFYNQPNGKNGKMSWCIECHNEYTKRYYERNRNRILHRQVVERRIERNLYAKAYRLKNLEKLTKRSEDQRQKYISDWIDYFKKRHSEIPRCQVCGKDLEWKLNGKRTIKSVYFDHKSNGIPIKDSPRSWYESHPHNTGNIKIWEQCNFGILCGRCNFFLPTDNREEWFGQIRSYIYGV